MAEVTSEVRSELIGLLPRLTRFCHALTGSLDDGDDLAQATVERALSRIETWQVGTQLDRWMFRIARNLWIDQVRARKVRGQTTDLDHAVEIAGEDGRRTVEMHLMLQRTREAMAGLPDDQKVVAAMVLVDGMSYREAAETLEIPIGTVMSRLSRARKTLTERVLGDEAALEDAVAENLR